MSAPFRFPSPVGGVAFSFDFAPSLVFVVLYAALLPVIAYRVKSRESRSIMFPGLTLFTIDRIILFSFRAWQSRNEGERIAGKLLQWMQTDIAMSPMTLLLELIMIFRCTIVHAMKSTSREMKKPLVTVRIGTDAARAVIPCVMLAIGIPMGVFYRDVVGGHPSDAPIIAGLRYTAAAILLVSSVSFLIAFLAAWRMLPMERKSALLLCCLYALFSVIQIYRFTVMPCTTTSLTSTESCSLNTPRAKAAFYIFHMAPEWISVALLVGLNIRQIFHTGALGDLLGDRGKKNVTVVDLEEGERSSEKIPVQSVEPEHV